MKPLVLIAEDEPYIVESLTFLMERAGLAVETALDGAATLEAIGRLRPTVLILDIMLRNHNGFELLKTVRANPALAGMKVLVLTAKGQESDRRTALELGADAFITKPFSNRDVVEQIQTLAGTLGRPAETGPHADGRQEDRP